MENYTTIGHDTEHTTTQNGPGKSRVAPDKKKQTHPAKRDDAARTTHSGRYGGLSPRRRRFLQCGSPAVSNAHRERSPGAGHV